MEYTLEGYGNRLDIYYKNTSIFYAIRKRRWFKPNHIYICDQNDKIILKLEKEALFLSDYDITEFSKRFFYTKPILLWNSSALKTSDKKILEIKSKWLPWSPKDIKLNEKVIGHTKHKLFSWGQNIKINFTMKEESIITHSLILLLIKYSIIHERSEHY
ncbi:conserved protein of unknown function [Tenacibaculum sp. 190524A02b]|uniref:hypothetical protein n=1 Tax=Tenacibaculum vairaonense TaxID=3137860 RepID=UPI0032B23F9A